MRLWKSTALNINMHHMARLPEVRPVWESKTVRVPRPNEIRPVFVHRFSYLVVFRLPVRLLGREHFEDILQFGRMRRAEALQSRALETFTYRNPTIKLKAVNRLSSSDLHFDPLPCSERNESVVRKV